MNPTDFDLGRDFGRLEGKVDEVLRLVKPMRTEIDSLKEWRKYLSGAFAVMTFILGLVLTLLK